MKKEYKEIEFEIIEIEVNDVMTASIEGNYDQNGWE